MAENNQEVKKKDEHSPLPWRVEGKRSIWTLSSIDNDRGQYIGKMACTLTVDCKNCDANAALIVKAVNSHGKLVEALREIEKGEGAFSRDKLIHANNTIGNMKEIASQALVDAGEGHE